MGNRWGPEGPPQEAYSRVTDPERFAPVVDAADALVAELVATYDVVAEPVTIEGTLRAVRLAPAAGAPLTIAVTDFPGLRVWRGVWEGGGGFPHCGCDACDETADDTVESLREWVDDTVAGAFTETLSGDGLTTTSRNGRGWTALDRAEYEALAAQAAPGTRHWAPWPRRTDSLSP